MKVPIDVGWLVVWLREKATMILFIILAPPCASSPRSRRASVSTARAASRLGVLLLLPVGSRRASAMEAPRACARACDGTSAPYV